MSAELVCIVCPMGCRLLAEEGEGGELQVRGNRCPRGAAYAKEELLSPKRTLTATCRLLAPGAGERTPRRLPCRTSAPFPRERLGELLALVYNLEARTPVRRGQVLIKDALGTGVDLVATRSLG